MFCNSGIIIKKKKKLITLSNYFLLTNLETSQFFFVYFSFIYLVSNEFLVSFLIMVQKVSQYLFRLRFYLMVYLVFNYFYNFASLKSSLFYFYFYYLFLNRFILLKSFLIENFVQTFLNVVAPYSFGIQKYLSIKTFFTSFNWVNSLRLRFHTKTSKQKRRCIVFIRSNLQKKFINFFKIMKIYYSLRLKQFIKARWKNISISFLSKSNNFFITLQDAFGSKILSLTKASLKDQQFRKRSPLIVEYLIFELFFTVFPNLTLYKKDFKSKEAKALVSRVRRAVHVLRGQDTKFTPKYLNYLLMKYRRFMYKFSFTFQHKGRAYNSANFFLKRLSRSAPIRYKVFKSLKPYNGCRKPKQRRL